MPKKFGKSLTMIASTMLAVGIFASSPAISGASIEAVGDERGTYQFYVDTDQRLLAATVRVIGPNNYVFEERSELGYLEWTAERGLADGLYTWEVIVVTAPQSAPRKPLPESAEVAVNPQDDDQRRPSGYSEPSEPQSALREVPREYKSVERDSGQFRISDGEVQSLDGLELSSMEESSYEPGVLARVAGTVLNWAFPAAHAQNFTDDVIIEKANPSVVLDSTASVGQNWRIQGATSQWSFQDIQNTVTPIAIMAGDGHDNGLVIAGNGRIGFGTASPSDALHVSDSFPGIRLEDTSEAQSWYLKNRNEGRFEISDSTSGGNQFSIEGGAPDNAFYIRSNGDIGIGTDNPQRNLHIVGNHIRIEDSNSTWDLNPGSQGLWLNQADPTVFGVLKLQNDAPANSLVANQDGVGVGTDSPETRLSVYEDAGGDANLLTLTNSGGSRILFKDRTGPDSGSDSRNWVFSSHSGGFRINRDFSGQVEMDLDNAGNLTIAGTLTQGSSREIKDNIERLDGATVLNRLSKLTLAEWSYKNTPDSRHAGPMAEEFHAAFGLGTSEKHIAPGDMAGLSLAAAQALYEENQALRERLEAIESQLASAE